MGCKSRVKTTGKMKLPPENERIVFMKGEDWVFVFGQV